MATRSERLDMRLTPDQKDLLERAAAIAGQPLTTFAVAHLIERAEEVLERSQRTVLSRRDAEHFLDLLDSAPAPAPSLRAALRRRKGRRG